MTIEVVSYYSSTNNNHGAIEKKIFVLFTFQTFICATGTFDNIFELFFTFNLKANELVVCVCYLKRKVLKG